MRAPFAWTRLSAADASNLLLEHPGQTYAIGLVGVFRPALFAAEDGAPDLERLREVLAPRVSAVPRLCQRVQPTRWGQGLPVWVDCPVDLPAHVRLGPRVDGDAALSAYCGLLLTEPLPRDRPLWDLVVLPGPTPDRTAIVLRLHHAIADGVGAVGLMGMLFDPSPAPSAGQDEHPSPGGHTAPTARGPSRAPTAWELVLDSSRTRARRVVSAVTRVGRYPAAIRELRVGLVRTSAVLRGRLPATSLLGPVGDRRGAALVEADLAVVRATAHAAGATVNDVLLAAVSDATGALLRARGEHTLRDLPVSIPVSLRADASVGDDSGNRVGVMLVRLPLDEPDRHRRLARIAAVTRSAKPLARAAGPLELTRTRWATRVMDVASRHQRLVALFVTNVPGPREPLRLGGAAMEHAWPLSTIAGNVRISVAALSYAQRLQVTVIYDVDTTPDARTFTTALRDALIAATPAPGPVRPRRMP